MSIPKNQEQVLKFVETAVINENGVLQFPRLYVITNTGKIRNWDLFVGICDTNDNIIPVTMDYINRGDLPINAIGMYWTEYGLEGGKVTVTKRSYVKTGKYGTNVNRTTPFTQAILDAKSDYDNKIKKGANPVREELLSDNTNKNPSINELMNKKNRGEFPWRIYAMALHDLKKSNNWNKIQYPCKVQYKMDGIFCIIVTHPKLPEIKIDNIKMHIDCYTRGRKNSENIPHILKELYPVLSKHPGLHLVAELWNPGYTLQELSGASRRQSDSKIKTETVTLDLNIVDGFYLENPMGFEERLAVLDDLKDELKDTQYIKFVPTYECASKQEILDKYDEFLKEGFEGAIVRNNNALYEFGVNKEIRSYNTMKLKPRFDEEYPIIKFESGTHGKEEGRSEERRVGKECRSRWSPYH